MGGAQHKSGPKGVRVSDVALSHAATWNYHVGFMRVQWLLEGENEKNKWDKIILATSLTSASCDYLQVRFM